MRDYGGSGPEFRHEANARLPPSAWPGAPVCAYFYLPSGAGSSIHSSGPGQ